MRLTLTPSSDWLGAARLVQLIERRETLKAAALSLALRRRRRIAGGIAGRTPALRTRRVGASGRSLEPTASFPAPDASRARGAICPARERTGWGPRLLAIALGVPHSTICTIL